MTVPVLARHDRGCPRENRSPLGWHSDAARRVSDTYELHRAAGLTEAIGGWFAVALADGASDGVLYEGKRDAAAHQHHHELRYAFIQIGPWPMSVCAAESFLRTRRAFAGAGIPQADRDHPAGGLDVIRRLTVEDQRSLVGSILSRGRRPASGLIYPRR